MRLVLFIGHHKVGSSSLQDYLARNSANLIKHGVLHPFVDFEGMSYFAATASGKPVPNKPLPDNIKAPHNALAFRLMAASHDKGRVPPWHKMLPAIPQMKHAIHQQVRQFEPHTIILASEVFSNFSAMSPTLVEHIANLFPDAETTVIATLRRIDDYLISWHGQRLMFGHKLEPLRSVGAKPYFGEIHFNYWRMLERWLACFPKAEFVIQDYADVLKSGGTVTNFFQAAKIKTPHKMYPEVKDNVSIHRGLYEISRLANHDLPHPDAAALRLQLDKMAPSMGLPPSKEIELIGDQNRREIFDKFKPINKKLGGLVGRSEFFTDLDQALVPQPVAERDAFDASISYLKNLRGNEDIDKNREFIDLAFNKSQSSWIT